ncbi:hypothetical protein LWI28_017243 [Acer negundo]|uniref:Uncharacterized protein n=1 Tax=Acer negundo TaxID=4023 RepID=A0AAD5J6I1_ACENE|nr:hypothetical protein LWI28_017243 [Acer negundo]
MGSAVLNKPPSPFLTSVYCFLLISFLFYIPHRIAAGESSGKSGVGPGPLRLAPSAVQQGSPKQSSPTQKKPESIVSAKSLMGGHPVANCGRDQLYSKCLPDPKKQGKRSDTRWKTLSFCYGNGEGSCPHM